MRINTSCVRSSAASTLDVKRYARLNIRREYADTMSSHAAIARSGTLDEFRTIYLGHRLLKLQKRILPKAVAPGLKQQSTNTSPCQCRVTRAKTSKFQQIRIYVRLLDCQ